LVSNPYAIKSSFKKPVLNKETISKILRSVSESEGFHFYLAIGEPTGVTAVNLMEFVEKLSSVEVQSVNFHYARKDFQKWIREILGDSELALRLGRIGKMRLGIRGEDIRSEILLTVKARLNEFKVVQ
jgi:hypothetical protein